MISFTDASPTQKNDSLAQGIKAKLSQDILIVSDEKSK